MSSLLSIYQKVNFIACKVAIYKRAKRAIISIDENAEKGTACPEIPAKRAGVWCKSGGEWEQGITPEQQIETLRRSRLSRVRPLQRQRIFVRAEWAQYVCVKLGGNASHRPNIQGMIGLFCFLELQLSATSSDRFAATFPSRGRNHWKCERLPLEGNRR